MLKLSIECDTEEEFIDYYNGPRYKSVLRVLYVSLVEKIKNKDDPGSFRDARKLLMDIVKEYELDLF